MHGKNLVKRRVKRYRNLFQKITLECCLERAFSFFLPDGMDLTPFYGFLRPQIQPLEATGDWQLKLDQLAERTLSWEECFEVSAEELCRDKTHPIFQIQTTRGGNSLLHLAVYQNRPEWIQPLSTISSLASSRNKYGLTPSELGMFLGRNEFKRPPPEQILVREGVEYLSHLQFESERIFDLILEKSAKAKREDAIAPEKIWMGIYFDREIQTGYQPKVSLRWIGKDVGFGIFAEQRLLGCTFAGEYTGIVREYKKKQAKDNYYCIRYTSWETGSRKFILDAEQKGNFTRYINHSETPNLGLQSVYWRGLPRMIFITLREICKGEQLTFDYGDLFWKECQLKKVAL